MKILYLIPARKGSKGLLGKNIKKLAGKPLICYSIEFALQNMTLNDELCISTDDLNVLEIAKNLKINMPFVRPDELASDTSSSRDVIMHAINFYENNNKFFDFVLFLQPTSPFRIKEDFENLISEISRDIEMIVSVKKSKENPYFNLFEECNEGYLAKSKASIFSRRQDCPNVYAFNGSLYLIRVSAIKEKNLQDLTKIKKIIMPENRSIDIDTLADWKLAEFYLDKN